MNGLVMVFKFISLMLLIAMAITMPMLIASSLLYGI